VSDGKAVAFGSIAGHAPGEAWVVFAHESARVTTNLFVRRMGDGLRLEPRAVQLTHLVGVHGPSGPRASTATAAIEGEHLAIAYLVERGAEHDVLFQNVKLSDLRLADGRDAAWQTGVESFVGSVTRLTQTKWRVHPPDMACGAGACVVVWRGKPRGATVVAVDAATGEERWRDVASPGAEEVGVGMSDDGEGLIAWQEDGKLRVAPIGKAGMGHASFLARAQGEHTRPAIARVNGAWLVGWTTFEGGHPEPYLARVGCGAGIARSPSHTSHKDRE
jgi:serine/threonine-protein kinase